MTGLAFLKPAGRALLGAALLAFLHPAAAQTLPPPTRDALDQGVGSRVVAFSVLGGADAISGGSYAWHEQDETLQLLKIPLRYEFRAERPYAIGDTGLSWSPVLQGSAGYVSTTTSFGGTPLEGNSSETSTYIAGLGGGARVHLAEWLSVLPAFEADFSYSSEHFHAGNAAGAGVMAAEATAGELVDWSFYGMTLVPQADVRLGRWWDNVKPGLTSRYAFYHGVPLQDAPDLSTFAEDSQVWINQASVEFRTPWVVGSKPLRVGARVDRTNAYGGLADAMKTGAFQTAGAHVALGMEEGLLGPVDGLGLGGAYTWSNQFTGWSVEIQASLQF
jgi:hypothetical protein